MLVRKQAAAVEQNDRECRISNIAQVTRITKTEIKIMIRILKKKKIHENYSKKTTNLFVNLSNQIREIALWQPFDVSFFIKTEPVELSQSMYLVHFIIDVHSLNVLQSLNSMC